MKELKTYISEGFFSNVGADNKIKLAIDFIKGASMNNKINSLNKRSKFRDSLAAILKNLEADIKKGSKLAFEYIKKDGTCATHKITISFEMTGSNNAKWRYNSSIEGKYGQNANDIALSIAMDLYDETLYPAEKSESQHSIAKTIKITEFKVS